MDYTKLKRLEAWMPIEILGVSLCLTGSDEGEYTRSFKDITTWCDKVRDSHLQPHAAHRALLGTVVKTIEYRLPATQFDEKQCKKMKSSLYKSKIPKLGISQKLPFVYRHAPVSRGGLGFPVFDSSS